ncbi:MAG: hypothetical protein LBK43_07225 [Treponema sp.]|jgi:hypothetical protein|nr:hypothetical protein [Treponema sp.]
MDTGILHSLISLGDFKAVLGLDDREDALSRYCLITATYTIEQYCKRRLLRRKHTDYLTFTGEPIFSLREYPVRRVLAVHTATLGPLYVGNPALALETLLIPNITLAFLMKVTMRIFPSPWCYGLLFGLQGRIRR